MPLVKRLYTIRVPPGIDLDKLNERLREAIRVPYAEIEVEKDGRLRIMLVGVEADVKDSWYRIKNVVAELWDLYNLSKKGEVSVDAIVKEIRRTFPPQALVEALSLRGYRAELLEGNVIRTNAPLDVVLSLASRIAEVLEEIKFDVRGTAAKRVVAAVAAAFDVVPQEVIEVGLKADVFEHDEEGKIVLKREWRQAIRRLGVVFRAGGLVGETGTSEGE
ncbi:protein of unknown function DUF2067 [Pyrolobus fumarii 1A]|uniref:DUF2067 domain-containing protein n=1 Tax=Pyrolobus fumarii (strain DSM 11204 / 1A) TaxID=694429 RepID=G0EET6_PYRF1|nr:DUF2067 domain-containing protein [Pyrolobus fumarii]AEM38050.1 protein of unknown function DUF2067 [Pyrolobus fumarii 1A]